MNLYLLTTSLYFLTLCSCNNIDVSSGKQDSFILTEKSKYMIQAGLDSLFESGLLADALDYYSLDSFSIVDTFSMYDPYFLSEDARHFLISKNSFVIEGGECINCIDVNEYYLGRKMMYSGDGISNKSSNDLNSVGIDVSGVSSNCFLVFVLPKMNSDPRWVYSVLFDDQNQIDSILVDVRTFF